jgi:hypothetical protein
VYLSIPLNLTETLKIFRGILAEKHSFIVFDNWIVAINGLETMRKEVIVFNLRYHPIICPRRLGKLDRNLRRDSKWLYPKYKGKDKGKGKAFLLAHWTWN